MRLLFLSIWASLLIGCAPHRPWNVVLFTFDTTRADFLGCYGKTEARTPHLDRLASEGFLFENAMASNPVTQAAHSTILTGVYPMVHGVRDNLLFRLPEERDTLAELLQARGYATGAAVGGFPMVASFGSQQGFEFYDDDLSAGRLDFRGRPAPERRRSWYDERPAGHVNDAILPWLRERFGGERPFFAWLHYWDPHEPHTPPAPYDQLFAHDLYSGEIAYADQALGALLEVLEEAGELEHTLVVMVADHGESRWDHNEATHAYLAYETTLHVPLIVRVPGEPETAGRRIAERVGTVDIVPTVLDLLGFGISGLGFQGRSLAPLMMSSDSPTGSRRMYYSESLSPRLSHGVGELRALYRGPFKYIHGPRPELYDLERDPGEIRDLSTERPAERERFERALQDFLDQHASPEAAAAVHEVDDDTRQRLEALGYLSTTGDEPAAVAEVLSREGPAPQDRVGDINLMSRLRQQLGSGQFRQALRTVDRLLAVDPDNGYYRGRLATAHIGLGQVAEAARVVDEAPEISSANRDDFLSVAVAVFAGGEKQRGLAMARRLVGVSETAHGRFTIAEMLRDLGPEPEFEQELDRVLALDETHRGARLLWARHLDESGDAAGAEEIYLQLLADFPLAVPIQLDYARLLRRDGRASEALPHLERATRLAPRYCDVRLERLEALVALEREDEAREAGSDIVEICGDSEIEARAQELLETVT